MTAPGWQNKKKKTLKARDSANGKALKAKRGAKMKHDAARARVSGKARTGKQRRKAVRNERRAARNKIDDEAKAAVEAAAATGGGDVVMATA
jgi:Skp family chaperone for outer membrane proteins